MRMRFCSEGLLLTATCEELTPFIRNGGLAAVCCRSS